MAKRGLGSEKVPQEKREEIASMGGKAPHSQRGFQAMSEEERREIAKKGGQHSHGGGRRSSE